MGNTSTIGLKTTYASGKRDNNKVSINKDIRYIYKLSKINNINFSIKFLIYINVLILRFFRIQLYLSVCLTDNYKLKFFKIKIWQLHFYLQF
jgi:hypothetical protein